MSNRKINSVAKWTKKLEDKSSLPKWITDQDYAWEPCNNPDWNKLRKALAIAVEALKKSSQQKFGWKIAKRALRRISELGK